MRLAHLRTLVNIAEHGSLSAAAKAQRISQPAVTKQVQRMESELGLPLLVRGPKRGAELTPAGERVLKFARQTLSRHEELEQYLALLKDVVPGILSLAASTIPGEYILPALLGRFKVLYPEIRITLRIGDTKQIINEVIEGTIELGIIGAKINNPRLHFVRFLEDELIVVVPHGHRWWNKTCIDVHNLIDEPIIIRERGSGTRISMENKLPQLGISFDSLNIIAEVGSTTAVKQAIKAKLGITLISERAVDDEIQLKLFKKIPFKKTKITRSFYIIRDKKRTPSPLSKALSHFLSIQN